MSSEVSKSRFTYFIISGAISIYAAIFHGDLISGNEMALHTIVTVFSILAGFLVAVMTIIAEPMGNIGRTWRFYELKRDAVRRRLMRQKFLFVFYIITLILIFFYSLVRGKNASLDGYVESGIVGLSVFCFVMSLSLPWVLMSTQLDRFDEIIDEKRKLAKR